MSGLVIIGGGIIGGASLYNLLDKGYKDKITVLERNDALAQESTSLSAGGIRNIWSTEVNMKMTSYSIEHFKNFKDNFGVNIGFEENGYLFTYYEDEWENIVNFKPKWDKAGVQTELITPEEIEEKIPGLTTGINHLDDDIIEMFSLKPIVGGLFGKKCAALNATSAAQAYFNLSKEQYDKQVDIKLNSEVTSIDINGKNVTGVTLADGEVIECDAVLLAAGAWSAKILENSGFSSDNNIPVEPIKRMLFVVSQPKSRKYDRTPLTIIDNGVYFRNEAENLIIGRADEEQEPGFDTTPDKSYYEDLINLYMQIRIDGAEYCRIQNMWGGLYAVNEADHNALIGHHTEIDNLFLATGFSGHGIMEAPAAGLSIAEIIIDGKVSTIPEAEILDPERIEKGELVTETIVI